MIFCADPHSATESVLISAAPPRCSISCLVCWAGVADCPSPDNDAPTSLMITLAPAAAMASAISRPMPPPEPVTATTLPSIMPAIRSSCAWGHLTTGQWPRRQPLTVAAVRLWVKKWRSIRHGVSRTQTTADRPAAFAGGMLVPGPTQGAGTGVVLAIRCVALPFNLMVPITAGLHLRDVRCSDERDHRTSE